MIGLGVKCLILSAADSDWNVIIYQNGRLETRQSLGSQQTAQKALARKHPACEARDWNPGLKNPKLLPGWVTFWGLIIAIPETRPPVDSPVGTWINSFYQIWSKSHCWRGSDCRPAHRGKFAGFFFCRPRIVVELSEWGNRNLIKNILKNHQKV